MHLPPGPHRRYNPLLDEWVLCSSGRLARPWQGQVEAPDPTRLPAYDRDCYLCPGNPRSGGARNPAYASTFAFDNDFPALRPEPEPDAPYGDELRVARVESGRCRVVCFSPRHDLDLGRMDPAAIRAVVDCWAAEVTALGSDPAIGHVQVFENRGGAMGCSNPHPHGQIWATRNVPSLPARSLAAQLRYQRQHGSDLLGDYLERERRDSDRLVCQNEDWVALVPFWAVWPFETLLLPRRRLADLPSLSNDERDALADILKRLHTRYDNLFQCPFPYSMGWRGRPTDGEGHAYARLHAIYAPPLLRSATVRKFLVGYELAAEPQRDLTPEQAAALLRETSERHYQDAG